MMVLLLIVIYIAFIGLGIPDSLFGPAWPAMHVDLNLPISLGALVTSFIQFGTMISAYFSTAVINKIGTKKTVIISTFLTAIGLLGYSFSYNIVFILLSSIPIGIGAGAIDAGLNNYVALHFKAMHMNFLHCFYGIGVSLSPYIMAFALSDNDNWRKGYLIAFFVQIAISLIILLSSPLWDKHQAINKEEEIEPVTLTFIQMIKTPYILMIGIIFFLYCSVEAGSGAWFASYFVMVKHISNSNAAEMAGLFFLGLAVGRFIAGLVSNLLSKHKLIFIGEAIMIIGVLLMLLPFNNLTFNGVALFLIGFGCGPIYPSFSAMTPEHYGPKYSQSIMGIQMTFSYLGFFLISPLLGVLGDVIGFEIFPYCLLLLTILTLVVTIIVYLKKDNKSPIYKHKN